MDNRDQNDVMHDYYSSKKGYYGGLGVFRFLAGMLVVAGSVGRHDYYDQCLAAVDCIAGDPPSSIITILFTVAGFALMGWGVSLFNKK